MNLLFLLKPHTPKLYIYTIYIFNMQDCLNTVKPKESMNRGGLKRGPWNYASFTPLNGHIFSFYKCFEGVSKWVNAFDIQIKSIEIF